MSKILIASSDLFEKFQNDAEFIECLEKMGELEDPEYALELTTSPSDLFNAYTDIIFKQDLENFISCLEETYSEDLGVLAFGKLGLWSGNPEGGLLFKSFRKAFDYFKEKDYGISIHARDEDIVVTLFHHDGMHRLNLFIPEGETDPSRAEDPYYLKTLSIAGKKVIASDLDLCKNIGLDDTI